MFFFNKNKLCILFTSSSARKEDNLLKISLAMIMSKDSLEWLYNLLTLLPFYF
jgi:hypothetical protein